MKKITAFAAIVAAFALTACGGLSSTTTTVRTIDPETGKVTGETVTDTKSAIQMVTESAKDKTLIASSGGFVAKMKATSGAETDSPMPSVEISAGNVDTFYVSVHKDQVDSEGIAKIITAVRGNLTITSEGIKSNATTAETTTTEATK